jgi:Flp pilus assembly protein TadD
MGGGVELMSQGLWAEAKENFDRAIQLDPDLAVAFGGRGLALLRLGREEEAQQDFTRCLTLDPTMKDDLTKRIRFAQELEAKKAIQ